ncbi:hypothetical protein COLU111180_10945 [Cohnella lubricantis]|uniref:Uncharacterized protein n=1 Tax=Cohnella lubricantis TaxID=2163172 RepID=A0A841TE86_9BACL|nr:hypothetical protein [Cohnella lubricantis]MBB6678299.1 hypothetical protein [Cohnella lubricantis]MBP2118501.1 hypothetical protein [Cohnella lubricantis]
MIEVLSLAELEQMSQEDKVAALQKYRAAYTIKDLSQAWGLTNPIQYYMWLKKQQIYEQIVRRSDKFEPSKEWKRMKDSESRDEDRVPVRGLPADQFRYGIDTDSTGPELAHVFRRLADFLSNESGHLRCRIELKALPQQAPANGEWKEEEPGA